MFLPTWADVKFSLEVKPMPSNNKSKHMKKKLVNFNCERINLLCQLRVINSRLRRLPILAMRGEFMEDSFDAKRYLARLKKQKTDIINRLSKTPIPRLKRGSASMDLPSPLYRPLPELGSMRATTTGYFLSQAYSGEILSSRQPGYRDLCPSYDGAVAPYYWTFYEHKEDIHHDSTTSLMYEDQWVEVTGDVVVFTSLYDDESMWRDDNCDVYWLDFDLYWELPSPFCDVRIECKIDVSHYFNFTNGADDGGGFGSYIGIAHTGSNGIFDGDDFIMYSLMEGSIRPGGDWAVIDETPSGNYGPTRRTITLTFDAAKGSINRVALGHVLQLFAQDGLVELNGTLGTHDFVSTKPLLRYVMTPAAT